MRTYDFSPLYRSTIGFDRLFDMLDQTARGESDAELAALQHRADQRRRTASPWRSPVRP